jgi:hypothetical protein
MGGNPLLLLAANGLELAVGAGIVLALGLADTHRASLARLGLAYAVGLAAVGILGATLALVGVLLNLPELGVLALCSLAIGLYRRQLRPDPGRRRLGAGAVLAGGVGLLTTLLLAVTAAAYAVSPLVEWDGWAIWGTKAQALYDFGGAAGPVLSSTMYAQPTYPLLLPVLEATDYRAMGMVDTSVVHLQLALLAVAFAGGLFGLLWRRAPSVLIAATALAILAAPEVLQQLGTGYADIPLAFFVALGVVALARWLADREAGMLPLAVLFLGAGTLTKSEGAVFAAAAFVPALAFVVLHDRRRCGRLLAAAAAVVAVSVPWRIFTAVHHLAVGSIRVSDLLRPSTLASHASRVVPAAHALAEQLGPLRWAELITLVLLAFAAAVLSGNRLLASFAATWLIVSFAGLVLNYWISPLPLAWYLGTSDSRVVDTLVIGAAALAPLLVADAWTAGAELLSRRREAAAVGGTMTAWRASGRSA